MAETVVTNPTTVTIADANIVAQNVTSFLVKVGVTPGGPYTTSVGTLPNSSLVDSATGATGPFSDITWAPPLAAFTTYYAVCEAVNVSGDSTNSPEVAFTLTSAPSAPTGFTVS
jgi:hypothetical protein